MTELGLTPSARLRVKAVDGIGGQENRVGTILVTFGGAKNDPAAITDGTGKGG